jgi:hypothetical protein
VERNHVLRKDRRRRDPRHTRRSLQRRLSQRRRDADFQKQQPLAHVDRAERALRIVPRAQGRGADRRFRLVADLQHPDRLRSLFPVYVAARAPDAEEDYTGLAKTCPTPPASAGIVWTATKDGLRRPHSCAISRAISPKTERVFSTPCNSRFTGRCSPAGHARSLAFETELLCGLDRGSHDRPQSLALHGEAYGRDHDRGSGEPSLAYIPSAGDRRAYPESRRRRTSASAIAVGAKAVARLTES